MNLNNNINNNKPNFEEEPDIPFNIGTIVEKGLDSKKKKPAALKPMMNSSSKKKKSTNNDQKVTSSNIFSSSTVNNVESQKEVPLSFPKPDPNKRYTTRPIQLDDQVNATTSSNSGGGFSQKPVNNSNRGGSTGGGGGGPAPAVNERPIETSEFLQVLRQTMMMSNNKQNNNDSNAANNQQQQQQSAGKMTSAAIAATPIRLDAGSQEKLDQQSFNMDSVLRVARSSVPAQRAAALRSLHLRCENASLQERKSHDYFINAPADVASAFFHQEESGPRLAMLSHLAYEDASQTVRESALLVWLTILSSSERDDDILDTLVLAAITGAPTDEGDNNDDQSSALNIDEDSEEQKKIDEEELRKRRQLAGGDTVPREMDDVDLRCGPTGVTIERRYFTLEAVTKLLRIDPALGLARLGVYRTLLDRAVGRAADHDPVGSSLDTNVGGSTLLDNKDLWRAVAVASHESATCAAYICEHKSFFVAFQLMVQATIGAHRGANIPTTKLGKDLLPCVRDALIAILSAVHSHSARAHRMLPKLWSEGGLFLLLKYLETIFEEEQQQKQQKQQKQPQKKHVDPNSKADGDDNKEKSVPSSHSASQHFSSSFASQCCALLCCIIRAAVRFNVPLSSESLPFEEEEIRQSLAQKELIEKSSTKKNNNKSTSSSVKFVEENDATTKDTTKSAAADEEQKQKQKDHEDPEVSTWFGEVYSFLVLTARHVGSFAVLEMLLLNEATVQKMMNVTEKDNKDNQEQEPKLKPIYVRQHAQRAEDSSDEEEDEDEEQKKKKEEEENQDIRFVKTDLKRTMDEVVFVTVEESLDKLLAHEEDEDDDNVTTSNCNHNHHQPVINLEVSTATHLLATWIGEGSLVAIFYGDRDDDNGSAHLLNTKIEPLLDKSLKVLRYYIFDESAADDKKYSGCIVFDAFAHGLARIIDVIVRCYPKVRSRVAHHLQEIFSTLITTPTQKSVFRITTNNNKDGDGDDDHQDVDRLLRETKEMVAEILGTTNKDQQNNNKKSSSSTSFTSKEESLSRLTRLSSVGELLRTAEWLLTHQSSSSTDSQQNERKDDQQQQQQLSQIIIRSEVVTCVALNLVRVAMRCRGAADTALSAGLALLLPIKDSDSAAIDLLRESLANSLIEITSAPQPKVTQSLPVSLLLDPLSAWMTNPSMFSPSASSSSSSSAAETSNKQQQQVINNFISEAEAALVRINWAQWINDLMTKVTTIAGSLMSAPVASIQLRSLLPHPLSILSSCFLASFCNEDPRELAPKFFTSSPRARKTFEHLAVNSFVICCMKDETPRCRESLRQLRKEALETICRCADQNGDCVEMLLLLTVAALLRGAPDTWAPLLKMWLERAHWLLSANEMISRSPLLRSVFSSPVVVLDMMSSSSSGGSNNKNNTKRSPLLLTANENDAMNYASAIIDGLSDACRCLPPDESSGDASTLPIFVKAALACVAELTAPCGEFVRENILDLIEERLWLGADDTVRQLQKKVLAENGSKKGASEFWVQDLMN